MFYLSSLTQFFCITGILNFLGIRPQLTSIYKEIVERKGVMKGQLIAPFKSLLKYICVDFPDIKTISDSNNPVLQIIKSYDARARKSANFQFKWSGGLSIDNRQYVALDIDTAARWLMRILVSFRIGSEDGSGLRELRGDLVGVDSAW